MSTAHDPMRESITLHGLGFIQVQLPGEQRLHVWHPDLPRRKCFEHSSIHDHRFSFISQVLVGSQINVEVEVTPSDDGTHVAYLHEGTRQACGGRPWVPQGRVALGEQVSFEVEAGRRYMVSAYQFHRTIPSGDGRVATIMRKTAEYDRGAQSLCLAGVEPDTALDRFQWPPERLWAVVTEVLLGITPPAEDTKRLQWIVDQGYLALAQAWRTHDGEYASDLEAMRGAIDAHRLPQGGAQ